MGILVVRMAVIMMTKSGMTANLIPSPIRTKKPQEISKDPTKGAVNSGNGMPMLSNLPEPTVSGKRNFWIPSEMKMAPTEHRINMIAFIDDLFHANAGFLKWPMKLYDMLKIDAS